MHKEMESVCQVFNIVSIFLRGRSDSQSPKGKYEMEDSDGNRSPEVVTER